MHVTDQGCSPAWSDSIWTLLFHACKISCHGDAQLVSAGGPTTMRINRRYSTSNFVRSSLWMARCDAPKQATGDTTLSKYRSLCKMDTPLSHNIHLFAWKVLDAAWRWCWRSRCVFLDPAALIMQPSHLCASSCFSTRNTIPLFVCKEDGGWTSEVKTTVFAAFNCNPMFCNLLTRSSNKAIASAAVRAKRRISSAKRRSSKDGIVSPRSKPHPFVSAFRLQADIPHCNTLQNKRGLNTHPYRTPAWMGKRSLLLCSPCTSPDWFE